MLSLGFKRDLDNSEKERVERPVKFEDTELGTLLVDQDSCQNQGYFNKCF